MNATDYENSTAYNAAEMAEALSELLGPVERERLSKLPWARGVVHDLIHRIVNLRRHIAELEDKP